MLEIFAIDSQLISSQHELLAFLVAIAAEVAKLGAEALVLRHQELSVHLVA